MRATDLEHPLLRTVIDLDEALGGDARLLLAGGLGLFLKQRHLMDSAARTLLPVDQWPTARTTQDIDIVLRAEIVASAAEMARFRAALDRLGCVVDEAARWMKFTRAVDGRRVVIDLNLDFLLRTQDGHHHMGEVVLFRDPSSLQKRRSASPELGRPDAGIDPGQPLQRCQKAQMCRLRGSVIRTHGAPQCA